MRVLKPGGRIAMHEYDHEDLNTVPKDLAVAMAQVNKYAAMPANAAFDKNVIQSLMEKAGFEDVVLKDLSPHIVPMLWLFYVVAIIPYFFIALFGLQPYFINVVAGVESYRGRGIWRYVQVSGRKPA
jgi:sterol 24-C-methyltransferase